MKIGGTAWLQMKKPIKKGLHKEETIYECTVRRYEERKERLYLSLQDTELPKLSLDAVYECRMEDDQDGLLCTGRIRERYHGEGQRMVVFEIENGFYKICLN